MEGVEDRAGGWFRVVKLGRWSYCQPCNGRLRADTIGVGEALVSWGGWIHACLVQSLTGCLQPRDSF